MPKPEIFKYMRDFFLTNRWYLQTRLLFKILNKNKVIVNEV